MKHLENLTDVPRVEDMKNVLCVLPHPDDGEFGIGGTVAHLKRKGARVIYLLITSGGAGIPEKTRKEAQEIRKKEQCEAAKILGVDEVHYLNYPDNGEYALSDVKKDIREYFEKISPDLVLTVDPQLPYEFHPDHIKCGTAVAEVSLFYENDLSVGFFFTLKPNQYVCIDEEEYALKFKALHAHKSQFENETMDIYEKYVKMKLKENGKRVECEYAEGFKVMKPFMFHIFEGAFYV